MSCLICFKYIEHSQYNLDISQKLINIYCTYLHNAITNESLEKMENPGGIKLCEDCFNSGLELKNLTEKLQNVDTEIWAILKTTMDTILEFSLQILCNRTQVQTQSIKKDKSYQLIEISVPKGFGLLFSALSIKSSQTIQGVKEEPDITYENVDYEAFSVKNDPFLDSFEEVPMPVLHPEISPISIKKEPAVKRRCNKILRVNLTRLQFSSNGKPIISKELKNDYIPLHRKENTMTVKEEIRCSKVGRSKNKGKSSINQKRIHKTTPKLQTLLQTENIYKIREKSSGFECRFCWKKHVKWEDHKNHIEEAHGRKRQFQCYACDKTFSQKHHMDTHVRIHTGEKPFECSWCSKRFSDPTAHWRHTKIHTGEKKYRCTVCKYGTSDSGAFGRHKLTHSNDYEFKCKLCKKTFKIKYNYMMHLKSHSGDKPFKCSVCSKSLKTNSSLKKHMTMHTGEKPFKCNFCPKAFNLKPYLKQHLRTHTREKPFSCSICHKTFSQHCTMWLHKKMHDNKVFNCNLCNHMSLNETDFKKHGLTHRTEKRQGYPFKCKCCGQYFKLKRTLRIHQKRFHSATANKNTVEKSDDHTNTSASVSVEQEL